MPRRAVTLPGATTVGPYSPAVRAGDFLFISGQIPIGEDGKLVRGGIEDQTRQCLENLRAVLQAAGASFAQLVQVTVYLVDMRDFEAMNRVYGTYFDLEPPARICVQVAGLPKRARVEITGIAYLGS